MGADADWHALAANEYCSTMQRLHATFDILGTFHASDFQFPVDVSPLAFNELRAHAASSSQQLHFTNECYRTLASQSDSLSLSSNRNKCSQCYYSHRLLSYCHYLIFRAASVTMRVTRPPHALHKFVLPISRVDVVDTRTWVTGDYPKRVAQALQAADTAEYFNFFLLKRVLEHCASDIVVIIGANDGFYTFASAARGCRTIAFEPQIGCLQNLYFNALLPIFPHPPLLYNAFVSDTDFSVDSGTSCDGGAQFTSQGARTSNTEYAPNEEPWTHPGSEKVSVSSMRLDDAVRDDVRLLLIDVEGAEVSVLSACESLVETRRVEHAIIEWTVNRWAR